MSTNPPPFVDIYSYVNTFQREFDEIKKTISAECAQHDDIQQEIQELNDKIIRIQEKLTSRKRKRLQKAQDTQEISVLVKWYTFQLDDLRSKNKQKEEELHKIRAAKEQEIGNFVEEMEAFEANCGKDTVSEKEKIIHETHSLEAEIRELMAELRSLEQEQAAFEQNSKKAEDLKQECADLIATNHGFNKDLDALQKEHLTYMKKINELQKEAQVDKELKELKNSMENARKERQHLRDLARTLKAQQQKKALTNNRNAGFSYNVGRS